LTSTNSYKWTKSSTDIKDEISDIQGTINANGKRIWVAVGNNNILTSYDTKHWLKQHYIYNYTVVGWNGNQWVAAGARPIMTSVDGVIWKHNPESDFSLRMVKSVAWDKTTAKWYAGGWKDDSYKPAALYVSNQDGSEWKEVALKLSPYSGSRINSIAFKNNVG
jgi:hypothetical protein